MPDHNRSVSPGGNDLAVMAGNVLGGFLANICVLMSKTQVFHWNATGPGFHGLHQLTETQNCDLSEAADAVAQRMRALRVRTPHGLAQMLQMATLDDRVDQGSLEARIRRLADDHVALAIQAQDLSEQAAEADDPATEKMLLARIAAHEKAAWLLRSHLG